MNRTWATLGEVAKFVNGFAFEPTDWGPTGRPIIRIQNLTSTDKPYNRTERVIAPKYLVKPGDLLVSWSASLGVFRWSGSEEAWVNQHIFKVIPDGLKVDDEYLRHALVLALNRMTSFLHGSTMQHVNRMEFLETKIPLPALPEQRRIAAILDKSDSICRSRRECLAIFPSLVRSLYAHIVGHHAAGRKTWPVRSIESLASRTVGAIRTGPFGSDLRHSEFVEAGITVLGIDNAVENEFRHTRNRYISPAKFEELRRYQVCPGDVIITIMGTTGRSAVVPEDIGTAINTKHLCCITLDHAMVEPEYIAHAIHCDPDVAGQVSGANRGAIMDGLNMTVIKALQVHVPPLEVQRLFSTALSAARSMRDKHLAASADTDHLFQSLVRRAFSGELIPDHTKAAHPAL